LDELAADEEEEDLEYEGAEPIQEKSRRQAALDIDKLNLVNLNEPQLQIILAWFEDNELYPDRSYHDQVREIATGLRSLEPIPSFSHIGQIFGRKKGTIQKHLTGEGWTGNAMGRPTMLSDEHTEAIRTFIIDRFDAKNPASYDDIAQFLVLEFELYPPLKVIRYHVAQIPDVKMITGEPMEDNRVEADPTVIENYYKFLEAHLKDFPAALVLNLDERGHDDWVDAHSQKVAVPISFTEKTIPVPVSRKTKRTTLLGAIVADGSYLKPLVILQRSTCEMELYQIGYTPRNAMLRHQENGFIDTPLFNEWTDEVLFPYIMRTRAELGYQGPALVILDGCTSHGSDDFLDKCSELGVIF
jgi:hypothetical protein